MKPESIVFAVAGTFFGLIVGWVIGTQQATARPAGVGAAAVASAPAETPAAPAARPMFDESQATALRNVAERDTKNVESRVQLGNLYFDAERYQDAIRWYEEAFALNSSDANVSTDLAVCYYYTNQADKAVAQFEQSLKADPRHVKTYLNLGIVRAFGQQDLKGAAAAWERVLELAPGTQEAQAARRALDNLNAAHPGGAVTPPAGSVPPAK